MRSKFVSTRTVIREKKADEEKLKRWEREMLRAIYEGVKMEENWRT